MAQKKATNKTVKKTKKADTVLFKDLEQPKELTKKKVKKTDPTKKLKRENELLKQDLSKYKMVMLLLIILLFVSVISQVFNHYSDNKKDSNDNLSVLQSKKLSLNDKVVKELYNEVSMFKNSDAGNYMGYFYEVNGMSVESLPDDVKVYMGLSLVDVNKYINKTSIVIPGKKVKKQVEKIFGKDIKYENKSLGSDNLCYLSLATYNNRKDTYEVNDYNKCSSKYDAYYGTKLVSAEKFSNRIELVEKIYYGEYANNNNEMALNIYRDIDDVKLGNVVVSLPIKGLNKNSIIEDYKDNFYSYRYTFYLDNSNYYFNSVERLSD